MQDLVCACCKGNADLQYSSYKWEKGNQTNKTTKTPKLTAKKHSLQNITVIIV